MTDLTDLDHDPLGTRQPARGTFAGGVEFARDSGGIHEPTKDFPRSGYACYGCPGVSSEGCCQHVRRGLVLRVAVPESAAPTVSIDPEPAQERPPRRLFRRRNAR